MVGHPHAVIGLGEDMSVFMHLLCIHPHHDWSAVALANLEGGFYIRGEMNLQALAGIEAGGKDAIEAGACCAVEKVVRGRGWQKGEIHRDGMSLSGPDALLIL